MGNITPLPPRKPKALGYYMGMAIGVCLLLMAILATLVIIKWLLVLLLR